MTVLDKHGFVKEGEHVIMLFPPYDSFIPFRVKSIANKEAEYLNYGPVPYTFTGYPEGVIPGRNVTEGFTFKDITKRLPPELAPDMFYHDKAYKLIHAYINITPHLFRIFREIPVGVKQIVYMELVGFDVAIDSLVALFGYKVGIVEQFFLPDFHINWFIHNATNMDLRTNVMIKYAEYNVEIPRDANLIFNLLMRKIPAYWYTLPITSPRIEFERMFEVRYGFPREVRGFPFYKAYEREKALREIPPILEKLKI